MLNGLLATFLTSSLLLASCTSAPRAPETIQRTVSFHHADARLAANRARAQLGQPPMEAEVRITCDARANQWVVTATPADMERVEALASKLDHD